MPENTAQVHEITVDDHRWTIHNVCDCLMAHDSKFYSANWSTNNRFLHHDNTPTHTVLAVQQFLVSNNMADIPHPPYLPDFTPCNVYFFPKIKIQLKERFDIISKVQEESQAMMNGLTKDNFHKAF